jgi:polysaccharide biosynthesis transport protein
MMNNASDNGHPFGDPHGAPAEGAVLNPLLMVHRLLRGRYILAIALGVTLAIPAAIAGHRSVKDSYVSRAIVRVNPEISSIIHNIPEFGRIPEFDAFVNNQVTYLTSERVIRLAAENPRLREAGWPQGPAGILALQRSVKVANARRTTTIMVEGSHRVPQTAQLVTNAVLDAYIELHGETLGLRISERQASLSELVQRLSRELNTTRESAFQLAEEYGADTLERRHRTRVEQLDKYDAMISQLEIALVNAESRRTQAGEGVAPGEIPPLSTEELAQRDAQLKQMLDNRASMEARLESLSIDYGPNHRVIRELSRQIVELGALIDRRADQVARLIESERVVGDDGELVNATTEEIRTRLEQYRQLRARVSDEVREFGRRLRLIQSLDERSAETKRQLDEASRSLEQLRVEAADSRNRPGRVEIAQRGELPLAPSETKRKQLTAAGAMGGFGVGVGLIALYGLLRPTYRYIDEVEHSTGAVQLLGTLPDYSRGDPEQHDMAALSVHHLRNALQSTPHKDRARIIAITSPSSGDGKTSLVMALGTSFAASGQRTALIDMDLVGRGLTRELGFSQQQGLPSAIAAKSLDGLMQTTPVKNLWVLGAGKHGQFDPTRLSKEHIAPLIEALRQQFDNVLIDSGPLLGSLEANLVAPMCDRVVVAVSRGQNAKLVKATIERLRRINATCAGIVFNKAAPVDFRMSVSHASIRSQSFVPRPGEEAPRPGTRASLMEAVAGISVNAENSANP